MGDKFDQFAGTRTGGARSAVHRTERRDARVNPLGDAIYLAAKSKACIIRELFLPHSQQFYKKLNVTTHKIAQQLRQAKSLTCYIAAAFSTDLNAQTLNKVDLKIRGMGV